MFLGLGMATGLGVGMMTGLAAAPLITYSSPCYHRHWHYPHYDHGMYYGEALIARETVRLIREESMERRREERERKMIAAQKHAQQQAASNARRAEISQQVRALQSIRAQLQVYEMHYAPNHETVISCKASLAAVEACLRDFGVDPRTIPYPVPPVPPEPHGNVPYGGSSNSSHSSGVDNPYREFRMTPEQRNAYQRPNLPSRRGPSHKKRSVTVPPSSRVPSHYQTFADVTQPVRGVHYAVRPNDSHYQYAAFSTRGN